MGKSNKRERFGRSGQTEWYRKPIIITIASIGVPLIIIGLIWLIPTKVENPPDIPEKGWRMYFAPTGDGGPGSLVGEMENSENFPIALLTHNAQPVEYQFPEIYQKRQLSISLGRLSRIFGRNAAEAGFNANDTVSYKLKLIGAKKITVPDKDLKGQLTAAIDPTNLIANYKKFYIVREAITATGIEMEFDRGTDAAILNKLNESASTQPTDAIALVETSDSRKLVADFKQDLYVFYHPQEIDTQLVAKIESAFTVGVTADAKVVNPVPGKVGTVKGTSSSFMIHQKNGPFGSVGSASPSAEVKLPDGATILEKTPSWTTNGKESSRGNVQITERGDRVIARSTIRGNDKAWGPRTWGELHITVKYKLPDTSKEQTVTTQVVEEKPILGSEFSSSVSVPEGKLTKLWVAIKDVAKTGESDTVAVDVKPDGTAAEVFALNGQFKVAYENGQIKVNRLK